MRQLARHGLRPDTSLGQHFLLDENLVDVSVREAEIGPDDTVLEIGPGVGVLTVALARKARTVHAVEVDRRLEPALTDVLADAEGVHLIWADAVRLDVESLDPPPTRLVANLPYSIATPARRGEHVAPAARAALVGHGAARGRRPVARGAGWA